MSKVHKASLSHKLRSIGTVVQCRRATVFFSRYLLTRKCTDMYFGDINCNFDHSIPITTYPFLPINLLCSKNRK